jgi:hypothetical protein
MKKTLFLSKSMLKSTLKTPKPSSNNTDLRSKKEKLNMIVNLNPLRQKSKSQKMKKINQII